MGHWLDGLLGRTRVQINGVDLPLRDAINFIGAAAVDNPAENRTDVTVGAGGGAPHVVNVFSEGNKTFNGDGSAGAVQIYPLTILFTGQDGNAIYNFEAAGVEEGWLVLFDVEGSGATLEIQNQGDELITLDIAGNSKHVSGIYFNGDDWRLLQTKFNAP